MQQRWCTDLETLPGWGAHIGAVTRCRHCGSVWWPANDALRIGPCLGPPCRPRDGQRGRVGGVMTCWVCGGAMTEARVTHCVCEVDPPILLLNVPAVVCDQCGERLFTTATLAAMDRIRGGEASPLRTVTVCVYDVGATASAGESSEEGS